MARDTQPEAPPVIGEDLTPEQAERAWLLYFYDLARKQRVLVARAKSALDEQTRELTGIFRQAKADANLTRKELTSYLEDGDLTAKTLTASEERRLRHKNWLGQPVGFQPDLFDDQRPQEIRDEAWARGVGYAMGLRGEPMVLPDGMEARFAQPLGVGYHKGQEELAWALSAVGKIVDRRPDANAAPVNLEPEPDEDEQIDLEDAVRAVKRSGFMKPSGVDAGAEQQTAA